MLKWSSRLSKILLGGIVSLLLYYLILFGLPHSKVYARIPISEYSDGNVNAVLRNQILFDIVYVDNQIKIDINKKGDATITETILAHVPVEKHGIIRYIPYVDTYEDGKRVKHNISVKSVKIRPLSSLQFINANYETAKEGDYFFIKVGDADKVILGNYVYEITYTFSDIVRFTDENEEIYHNIIGTDNEIRTLSSSVEVSGVPSESVINGPVCYTGGLGSRTNDCIISSTPTGFVSETSKEFSKGIGYSFAVQVKKGTFEGPSLLEKLLPYIFLVGSGIFGLLASLYAVFQLNKYGKDKKPLAVAVQYLPTDIIRSTPLSIIPAIIGVNPKPIEYSAEIIELAIKGLLTIDRTNNKTSILISPEQKIKLEQYLNQAPSYLRNLVKTLTQHYSEKTELNSLSNIYSQIQSAQTQLTGFFEQSGLVEQSSVKAKSNMTGLSILYGSLSFIIFMITSATENMIYIPVLITLIFLTTLNGIITALMLKRSDKGYELYTDLLGLQKYIKTAEIKRIEFFNDPNKAIEEFEKLLPYAITFKLEKEWAKVFDNVLKEINYQPSWYTGTMPINHNFAQSVSGVSSAIQSLSTRLGTPPSKSSSGFSGGGGGAGGGSGGGGSSSW